MKYQPATRVIGRPLQTTRDGIIYCVAMADASQPPAASGDPIEIDPSILSGKPFVRGTRLSVDFLQGLLATGWTRESIQEVYPYISPADLDAALAYKA